jgi:hypothetical protein
MNFVPFLNKPPCQMILATQAMATTGTIATPWFLRRAFQTLSLSHSIPNKTRISFCGTQFSFPLSSPITRHSGSCIFGLKNAH